MLALNTGVRVLSGEGKLLGIYPEGTRSPGRPALPRQETGVAPDGALAAEAGAVVIPAAGDDRHRDNPADRPAAALKLRPRPGIRFLASRWTSRATKA